MPVAHFSAWTCCRSETIPRPRVSDTCAATGRLDLPISSASSSPITPAMGGRVVVRHSVIVRVCHWINALCLFVLLMSGLQIFNAHPMLNWGNATDFQKPFLALSANDKD